MTRRAFLGIAALAASNLAAARPPADAAGAHPDIRRLLDRLYKTFSYAPQQEPDWATMRACFLDGAVFVLEAGAGQRPVGQGIDAMIADWQKTTRAESSNPGFSEWIEHAAIHRNGKVASVDVRFGARQAGDLRPRQPGLDSLQLMLDGDAWKVTAFVVQREARS